MNIYALSSLLASYIILFLGVFIYLKDPKNQLNRLYMLACILLGYLAFVEFGLREAADAASAVLWFRIGFVWPFAISIYMHFVLVLTKSKALQRKVTYILLYVPALLFAVLELTTDTMTGAPRREYWGWTYSIPDNPLIYNINSLWFFFLTTLSLVLCVLYLRRTENAVEKRRVKFVLIALTISAVVGLITEGVFPEIDIKVPELTIIASMVEVILVAYGIHRYNIFALTPSVAAENIVSAMSNLLFLTQNDLNISLANESALHLLGYSENELMGKPFQNVFPREEWEKIQKSVTFEQDISNRETTIMTKDKRMIPVLLSMSVIRDKHGNNLGMLCVGSDLTDHKRAEEARRKEVLLKEIHHRVKNNMQIISSLLNLQSRYVTDKKYEEMFKESQNRIKSMALIHEKLYKAEDSETINLREYITDLVYGLVRSYRGQDITVTVEVEDLSLSIDAAIPCGLIINELVTNALKYAFPGKKGEVRVALCADNGSITLVVADNGIGISDSIDYRNTETLGLRLVTILAEHQLGGEILLIKKEGTEFCITFPNE